MKKIYLDNPYKKTLVTSPIPLEGEKNIFLPKETIFLKETPHYKGEISRINGEKREDGNLKVQLANHKESITLSLSWEERLQFLQDSMARVLLSISIKHLLQEDTVDYYLDKKSWIELETSDLSFRDMDRIEDLTNYLLQGNFPFYSDSYDEEDKTMIYIGEYEGVPHYGPHLQYTGEVSLIKITSL
ncbi:MAG: hypothetical protein Q4Q07_04080, partial [Tissierellia bacterium]|nr:hypothetical protein [Tissierellia bacterium]